MDWKKLVLLAWGSGLKSALQELAKDSSNKWDDEAIKLVDVVVKQILG